MKKVLALILSVVLISSVIVPSISVFADSTVGLIDRIEIESVSIFEKTNGYRAIGYDGESFWHYNFPYPKYTVYFKDNTSIVSEYGHGVEIYGNYYWFNYSDNQYYEHWTVGTNTVNCTFAGVECSFDVIITESPVDYIEVENTTVYENENGYMRIGNDSEEYWCYSYFYPEFTVHFKDKTTQKSTLGGMQIEGKYYSVTCDAYSLQDENHWTLGGTYTVPCSFLGAESSFDVTVIERPAFDYFVQDEGIIIQNYTKQDENIEIPAEIAGKPVVGIYNLGNCDFKSITIPASVKYLSNGIFYKESLENIFVSPDNEYYADIDGVLTDKKKYKIIAYPLGKGNAYTVPVGVIDISVFDNYPYQNVLLTFDESQFITIDGVIYANDMKTVVKCKTEVSGSYIMPETVIDIMPGAFAECDKITDVKVSSSVTEITYAAFAGCSSMTSIDLPEGLVSIGDSAFLNSGLESVNVPNGVTEICSGAFFGCEKLQSVSLSQNITEIQGCTFSRCFSLKAIDIPGKVTKIGFNAFSNCSDLSQVNLPQGLKIIDYGAFYCCSGLSSINLPNALEQIGDGAFYASGLTALDIPDSVNEIESNAFSFCTKLESISIGKGLTFINSRVFEGCTSLKSITIPQNIEIIGQHAFSECSSLKTVVFQNDDVEIYFYAFFGCDLSDTRLPKHLRVLNEGVLMSTNIANIDIPNTVTDIVYRAFGYCKNLSSIDIPSSVTSIGECLLCGCTGLESITVSDENQNYHDETNCLIETESKTLVAGCKNSIIPADGSVTSIGVGAFGDLTNLISITIPDTITSIKPCAFAGCTSLTSITIPSSVTSIAAGEWYGSFNHCSGLESITVDSGNTVYHSDGNCLIETESKTLILGCKNSVIPTDGSVTKISSGAFSGCSELTYIVIPDSVTQIGYYAFGECDNIKDVYYTGTKQQRDSMYIAYQNDAFDEATWHYNYEPQTYIPGDINEDGKVNNKDLTRLIQYLTGWNVAVNRFALDVNGDGRTNNKDLTRLFQYLSGWDVEIF